MVFPLSRLFPQRLIFISAVLLLVLAARTFAQSSDVRFPTPVSANEITDSIPARDLGDSRLTDYFYTFTGLPGDLLITVESRNLNGDVDVFTASELRPLLKITFYAGESASSATKNIYLRKRESLLLRVEGRTPNDDPGTYKIRFTGSFEPISGAQLAESEKQTEANRDATRTSDRKSTRVSTSGARIDEPAETAITPAPVITPSPEPDKTTSEATGATGERPSRSRRSPQRRTQTKPPAPDTARNTGKDAEQPATVTVTTPPPADAGTETPNSAAAAEEAETKPEAPRKRPAPPRSSSGRSIRKTATAKPASTTENGGRLVIEVKDGSRREFLMSDVRKVTVENGEILVEANDGFVQRIPMATVARMSIGP